MGKLGSAAVYLSLVLGANATLAQGLDAPRDGDMRKLVVHETPQPVSDAAMTDPEGGEHRLSDYAGKVVLLNFWATWCAPCRQEMPSLDRLQQTLGGEDFEVVTLATGRNSLTGIRKFFAEEEIEALPILLDPDQALARDMAVLGLPITVLLSPEGEELARLRGDADWSGPDATAFLEAVIASQTGDVPPE